MSISVCLLCSFGLTSLFYKTFWKSWKVKHMDSSPKHTLHPTENQCQSSVYVYFLIILVKCILQNVILQIGLLRLFCFSLVKLLFFLIAKLSCVTIKFLFILTFIHLFLLTQKTKICSNKTLSLHLQHETR